MASTVGTIPKPVRMDTFGVLRVGRTRVSLDSLVYDFRRGADAAEIQRDFDTLTLAEVHAAIAYIFTERKRLTHISCGRKENTKESANRTSKIFRRV